MTQQDKQLLLKDLCARLPYDVMVDYKSLIYILNEIDPACKDIDYITVRIQDVERLMCAKSVMIENIKPYLRPMSSMTDEETKYKLSNFFRIINTKIEGIGYVPTLDTIRAIKYIDWLNANHFDYRGLIDRGLALEAPEGMYNIIKK